MSFYSSIRKFVFQLDPELAHSSLHVLGRCTQSLGFPLSMLRWMFRVHSPELETTVWNIRFPNPVGLAAGFDKNATLVDFMASIGFGFVEIGSVTNRASGGNPRPRLFRLEADHALINRMGLNNAGVDEISHRLRTGGRAIVPIGINVAKTHSTEIVGADAIEDMAMCFRQLADLGDYLVLNVSCPNTKEGKTFEEPSALSDLLAAIVESRDQVARRAPLLVKLSPDSALDKLEQAIVVCEERGVDGYVISNTTTSRHALMSDSRKVQDIGKGGLSGRPLYQLAKERVEHVYRLTDGKKPIIGVGGVDSALAAYEMICAGASLVQLYSGLVYQGPGVVGAILNGLVQRLRSDGLRNIAEAVGSGIRSGVSTSTPTNVHLLRPSGKPGE